MGRKRPKLKIGNYGKDKQVNFRKYDCSFYG